LSISGHHEESWQPAWGIRTALCAIRAFMAGEAKGQVGGLDMSESGRLRLAKESRNWRCAGGCGGRTNAEVLKESEEEWKESEEGKRGVLRKETAVPEELRLEYRDDLERGPPTPRVVAGPSSSSAAAGSAVPSAIPKAGPVANLLARSKPPPSPLRSTMSSTAEVPSSLVNEGTPVPTTTTPAAQTLVPPTPMVIPPTPLPGSARPAPTRTQNLSTAEEAVPWWVDKAIVGVIIGLVVMLIKKLTREFAI
jgi:ubiquitin-conjugating enzyme E2 J1